MKLKIDEDENYFYPANNNIFMRTYVPDENKNHDIGRAPKFTGSSARR